MDDHLQQEHFREQHQRVVIVGAGCFGLSTAYHLLIRGYTNVTILDRSTVLPAPDASSNDINRIVRSSYNDRFYAGLAREAIKSWKDRRIWGDTYHESGVLVLDHDGSAEDKSEALETGGGGDTVPSSGSSSYADEAYRNDLKLGCSLVPLPDPGNIRSAFPSGVPVGSFDKASWPYLHCKGYINRDGGWADAGQGVRILLSKVQSLGAVIHAGKSVRSIQQKDGTVTGVSCTDGDFYEAELVVIATGSWSPSAFPDLGLQHTCLATGQCVAMIQLTESEGEQYKDCPVVLGFVSGFYVFPPTAKNVLKVATHTPGFTHTTTDPNISTPRTILSDPDTGLAIPKQALKELRKGLGAIYPDLARKPFSATRLCWYNDTPDANWIISKYPRACNLILATAGSGHAYKFLPVVGRLVADLIEDKMEPSLVEKFSVKRMREQTDKSRSGPSMELDLSQLCSLEDLNMLDCD